jgi:hypothetical protein
MVLNESLTVNVFVIARRGLGRFSLILDSTGITFDFSSPNMSAVSTPTPQLSAVGNTLQGTPFVTSVALTLVEQNNSVTL